MASDAFYLDPQASATCLKPYEEPYPTCADDRPIQAAVVMRNRLNEEVAERMSKCFRPNIVLSVGRNEVATDRRSLQAMLRQWRRLARLVPVILDHYK